MNASIGLQQIVLILISKMIFFREVAYLISYNIFLKLSFPREMFQLG